jgi:uncharacterized protein with von Willebrand factor type A (vWA) domain
VAEQVAADLATISARFARLLRDAGVPASPERAVRFAAAVAVAHPRTLRELYWLARVTLVDDHTQLDAFDQVFRWLFGGFADEAGRRGDLTAPPVPQHRRPGAPTPSSSGPQTAQSEGGLPAAAPGFPVTTDESGRVLMTASVAERLRHKDFAAYTPEEKAILGQLLEALRIAVPQRRARRTTRAPAGRRLDVRRTLRRAHRTGGDPVRRDYRRRRQRPRNIVLIADVSGSMEPYARVYLHLLLGAVRGAGAEAFVMATRLTRLSGALAVADPDVALARAAQAAPDWSGGTRLGASLKAFLDVYGRRGMARGAVVVIVSDGWERADPELLGEQMARLARLAHRVIWVNPRSAAEDYEPLVGGMAAALPHVDVFLPGHSLEAVEELVAAIQGGAQR